MPGTFQAAYNGTKALLDSFSFALRAELADSGVTVTCLMPGATETDFSRTAQTCSILKLGTEKKQSAAEVAQIGLDAMQRGRRRRLVAELAEQAAGAAISHILPAGAAAEMHRKQAACSGGRP